MPVAPDYLPDIGFAHLHLKDQFAALLYLCHENLFRRLNQLPDDKLEKGLHGKSGFRRRGGFFAGLQDHTRNG